MIESIDRFAGEFHFLSNFHNAVVLYDGVTWPSVEHAFQAAKTLNENQRLNILDMTAGEAKRYGKAVTLRADWEDIKLDVMEELVRTKFQMNEKLRAKLLLTEDLEIVEGNTWGDTFWGVCKGVGENHLGLIIMKVRDEIKANARSI